MVQMTIEVPEGVLAALRTARWRWQPQQVCLVPFMCPPLRHPSRHPRNRSSTRTSPTPADTQATRHPPHGPPPTRPADTPRAAARTRAARRPRCAEASAGLEVRHPHLVTTLEREVHPPDDQVGVAREGKLRRAGHGLFYAPQQTRFGPAPATDGELLRAFLIGRPFVITGPPHWNALGLGSTAMFAATLVYNTRRTGELVLDGRRFLFRRVLFPENPPREWFVIDLVQHRDMAGLSVEELEQRLASTVQQGHWNREELLTMAHDYGTRATQALVERCLERTVS